MLRIESLVVRAKDDGRAVIEGLSFSVDAGEVVRLAGTSGSGKTTVALAVCGLLPAGLHIAGGSTQLAGREISALSPQDWREVRGRDVGIVFQDASTALNPLFTCGRHLHLAQRIRRGASHRDERQRSLERLRACGLSDAERIYAALPRELSGGQQQRVAFALATIEQPGLLVADEPTSALDPEAAAILTELLAGYVRNRHAGVLLITHDGDRLARVATRTVHLPERRDDDRPAVVRIGGTRQQTLNAGANVEPKHQVPPARSATLLEARDLSKAFAAERSDGPSHVALDRLTLTIAVHEMVAVTGPSGAGKTTLARCLAGLIPHDAGTIVLDREPLPERSAGKPHPVQLVYQNPASSLSPLRTVGQSIAEALCAVGERDRATIRERTLKLLRAVNLPGEYAQRVPRQLSGGEQQRAAVARCLATSPRLIVLDEGTSSLDPDNAVAILALLKALAKERQMAVIVITHQAELAMRYCDRSLKLSALTARRVPPQQHGALGRQDS